MIIITICLFLEKLNGYFYVSLFYYWCLNTMCESCFKLIYVLLHLGIAMAKSLSYLGEKENINYTTCHLGSCTFFLWPCVHWEKKWNARWNHSCSVHKWLHLWIEKKARCMHTMPKFGELKFEDSNPNSFFQLAKSHQIFQVHKHCEKFVYQGASI